MFNITQRGPGPFTTATYTVDRWLTGLNTDTVSVTQVAASDTDRAAIGDESVQNVLQNVFTGNAAAGAYNQLVQRLENIRWLAGKVMVLSFWAKANAGSPKLGINLLQNFGTGGSPSANVRAFATGSSVTLGTTWAKYALTIAIPSIAGKTLGSNSNDFTQLEIWYSSGATNNAAAGNIGVQSGTIQLWGMQLEFGTIATALEMRQHTIEAALCQRFYQIIPFSIGGYNTAGNAIWQTITHLGSMRTTPTPNVAGGVLVNGSGAVLNALGNNASRVGLTMTATGPGSYVGTLILDAEL